MCLTCACVINCCLSVRVIDPHEPQQAAVANEDSCLTVPICHRVSLVGKIVVSKRKCQKVFVIYGTLASIDEQTLN